MTPKRLLIMMLGIAAGWSGYWGISAYAAQRSITAWFEDRRSDGWQAEWSDIAVAGFPNRIDRTIADLVLANPEAGWVWRAPFFQILGLSYDRSQVILIWPPTQQVSTPTRTLTIQGEALRASSALGNGTEIETLTANLKGLQVTSDDGWSVDATEVRLALRPTEGRDGWQDLGVEAIGAAPPRALCRRNVQNGCDPGPVRPRPCGSLRPVRHRTRPVPRGQWPCTASIG